MYFPRVAVVSDPRRSYQNLIIPGDYVQRISVDALAVNRVARSPRKHWNHDVGAADATYHGAAGADRGALAGALGPGGGAVDDPGGLDFFCDVPRPVAEQQSPRPAMSKVHGQYLGVVARNRPGSDRLDQQFRDQPLGKFALRIFVVED